MASITVFGAGAMGTAIAMHLARCGHATVLWASPHDGQVLPWLLDERRHPSLPEHLPDALTVMSPAQLSEAAATVDIAVIGAHSGGARSMSRTVAEAAGPGLVVGLAKGLEPETGLRMSEVYAEVFGHLRVVSVGGPCLAMEVAQELPSAAVFASPDVGAAEAAAVRFRSRTYHVTVSEDVTGVELCTVAKNVAAIGMGILDGVGKVGDVDYRNAKAALFTFAVAELSRLVVALGGRPETAGGLAGLGDTLVTSLGGRNRLFGEMLGEGATADRALVDLTGRGMTIEGVESARDVRRLAEGAGLDLPLFFSVHRILFEGAPARSVLECLEG